MGGHRRQHPGIDEHVGIHARLFQVFGRLFVDFLKENIDKPKAEYYIPLMVNKLINEGTAKVKVLDTTSRWFGVTYAADRQGVVDKFKALADSGEYPSPLF